MIFEQPLQVFFGQQVVIGTFLTQQQKQQQQQQVVETQQDDLEKYCTQVSSP